MCLFFEVAASLT